MVHLYQTHPTKLRDHYKGKTVTTVKTEWQWINKNKQKFPARAVQVHIWTHSCMTASTQVCLLNLDKITARWGRGAQNFTLSRELLTTDSCEERENSSSFRVWHPVEWPYSSRRPHIQEYMGSTNWTWRTLKTIKNRDRTLGG